MRLLVMYDPEADAVYVQIGGDHRRVHHTEQLDDSTVMADYDYDGEVVGIEILGVDEPVLHVLQGHRPLRTVQPKNEVL